MSGNWQDRFSFVAFGPFGPVYIQFGWKQSNAAYGSDAYDHGVESLPLSANGWPVRRIAKGRYQVLEPDGSVEVFSDHPCAP